MNVPILNLRGPNEAAIALLEKALARLRTGELINVAVAAEQRDGGMFSSFVVESSEAMRMRGALGFQATQIDLLMLQSAKTAKVAGL